MGLELVSPGKNPPEEINVIIEIPKDSEPVKYEVDKETGAIFVDRILSTPMRYPCNYGYVPSTLCGDGSGRRAGGAAAAAGAGLGRALPSGRRAEDER